MTLTINLRLDDLGMVEGSLHTGEGLLVMIAVDGPARAAGVVKALERGGEHWLRCNGLSGEVVMGTNLT